VPYEGAGIVGDYHLNGGSPAIDSANSNAPSQPLTDIEGNARVDDPLTTNTGAGVRSYDDRGAFEYQLPTCYALTLSHTGQGSNPVASPANSTGCSAGQYVAGASINLSGAVPATDWQITSWTGTDNDASTASINTVTMPASAHTASVTYTATCYALTLSHTGQGSNPVASPANSTGCSAGQYVAGANINLSGATPSTGWQIAGWTGTNNNASTASTNTVTMPSGAHTASVTYTATCYALTLSHTGQGSNPVASPANSASCSAGQYVMGETINLSGAVPTNGWAITSWTGTDNDAGTASTNTVTMPASARTASVNYTATCYALTLGHTGEGSDPVASPSNSASCSAGQYIVGESISLSGAVPASGWAIASWTGTNNDASMASTNTVTMPASAHGASVTYIAGAADIEVYIAGNLQNSYVIPSGESTRESYAVNNGPVRITSTNNVSLIAAMRAIWQEPGQRTSYSELMGLPKEQLSSEYWFPWYNNLAVNAMDQQFRFGNADSTPTTVEVYVGSTLLGSYPLDPGESVRESYAVNNGPIRVVSTDNKKIIAAMRSIWQEPGQRTSYSELMGLPKEQLSTEYLFPWYNNLSVNAMDQQFRFGNADSSATTVEVYVGSTLLGSYPLDPGESVRESYAVNNGPIRVVSTDNKKIIAAMRSIWQETGQRTSYSELMGLPKEQLSTEYWFPWYNNLAVNAMDQQFRFGVP
jgi:hypothetical protein